MNPFRKRKYVQLNLQPTAASQPVIPDGLWAKCPHCEKTIYTKETGALKLCPKCGGCLRMTPAERIEALCDPDSFVEIDKTLRGQDPLSFPGYEKKLAEARVLTGNEEGVVTGHAAIDGCPVVLGVMDAGFIMGSMGTAVGEKITRAFETATRENLPVVLFTASGGARMQEGILSLMQMAKVSAAVAEHSTRGLLYIVVITHPTTGGVTASFAMEGDIILSEPGALIGFAGRRVIEQTIKQSLPPDFQRAEFLLAHGFLDKIVPRQELRDTLANLLHLHEGGRS